MKSVGQIDTTPWEKLLSSNPALWSLKVKLPFKQKHFRKQQ